MDNPSKWEIGDLIEFLADGKNSYDMNSGSNSGRIDVKYGELFVLVEQNNHRQYKFYSQEHSFFTDWTFTYLPNNAEGNWWRKVE